MIPLMIPLQNCDDFSLKINRRLKVTVLPLFS